tara:strand:+ start:32530 stop:43281 length:10752 start_codon:yes stop_codon:yes gene_type:complete
MSIKKYFDVATVSKGLGGTTAHKISSQVESVGYHEQGIIKEERYIPQTDYSAPQNFARYGRAADYYTQAVKRIYNTFPYDGSLRERLKWENESTYVDLYIYNDRYPRTNGYINFSAGGWGTPTALVDGYGIPDTSADYEYIFFKGGPNANPDADAARMAQFTGSNYYEPSKNRGSNLALNVESRGASVEFWLKKDAFNVANTRKEVVFDLWNGVTHPDKTYGRLRLELTASVTGLRPFMLTVLSGNTGVFEQRLGTSGITTASVADGEWHHYALTLKQGASTLNTRFYVDGRLNQTQELSASGMGTLNDISGLNLRANIGALVGSPRSSVAAAYAGKLSGSLDEFRFWKAQRTSQEIGRFWFTQVGGGVNTDPEPFIQTEVSANLNLGVYFKFNEGITGVASIDSTVLDYSGRFSNGAWTCPAITAGNINIARNTGSAIVLSNAAIREYKDPIIYAANPSVGTLLAELESTGSSYDVNNNASIYNSMPAWIIEEDNDGDGELRKLTQIIASYFDTLHLQIKDLNTIKDIGYVSGSNKPLPFAKRLLETYGLVAPEIFVDADILNTLASRSEDRVFEKPLEEIKNIIYKNIYNNLVYIYKSKGTEKAFRNLIRCFGIDDELVKLNMYANDVEFDLRNNRRNIMVTDRFVNFNTGDNKYGTVYNYKDPSDPQSTGYISASAALVNGHALTLETEILFPLKPSESDDVYVYTNTISSSLFGMHGVQAAHAGHSDSLTTWASNDIVNFQVYAVRDEVSSDNVRFVLTSSGPRGKVPYLASELFEDVYNNTRWNLAVRIKPEKYPLSSLVDDAIPGNYTIELHGVQGDSGEILQEFTVAKTITAPATFITGSRRAYIGAHRTNFTGSMLSFSDVRINATRYWLDYVEDDALSGHILDTENYGTLHPHWFAYPFNTSSSYGDISKIDTLVFNWEFLTNTGSNAAGQFAVPDLSSGSLISSTNSLTASFGDLGQILNMNYTGRGDHFAVSSTTAIDKDFVVSSKLNLPENLQAQEMVKVLSAADQNTFTSDSRPTNYFFAFEKSMYQTISEEMINYFATLKDFQNLIGDPVNQWRPEYKSINFLKQKFFENVGNEELDFDKFYEYYKWFDSSLSAMLTQLAPASADVADNVRTVIENHILERPKYQRKFPFLEKSDTTDPTARVDGDMGADKSAQGSPDEFPQGTSFFTNTAFTRRQIGSSNTVQTRPWKHFHAPLPAAAASQNRNIYWHRYMEIADLTGSKSTSRSKIGQALSQSFYRRTNSPVKFSIEGTTVVDGVSRHHNSVVNYVFQAARAWGNLGSKVVGQGRPVMNKLVSSGSSVEKLISTTDVFYPNLKQRLGFGLSASNGSGISGPRHAPFSLYSSSVTTGFNADVVANYASGVMITNLHNDFVMNTDIPMQGPFTEKYVGGRFYRHAALNKGTDTNQTRGEGFRIEFDNGGSDHVLGVSKKSLVILPPNSRTGSTDPDARQSGPAHWPTAYRFREVAAKRPVNIKNIQMRTGSTIIGNYEKNYQVVNTNSRTKNDPFFNDQSFKFALYPETLATRGRFPLGRPWTWEPKSVLFGGTDEYATAGTVDGWESAIGGAGAAARPFSVSMWIKPAAFTDRYIIWTVGEVNALGGRAITWHLGSGKIVAYVGGSDTYARTNTTLSLDVWSHIAVTFVGGDTATPQIYFDGSLQSVTTSSNTDPASISTYPVHIAGDGSTSGIQSNLCDVAVWDVELTSGSVTEIYNSGSRFKLTDASVVDNLVSWWKLGDNPSDSAVGRLYDEQSFANATPQNMEASDIDIDSPPADSNLTPASPYDTHPNPAGTLNYTLPARTGSASNQTVIVNRFAGSGYEVMSLGYMDPAHEELSVYNANPYHNLSILDYGMSGSASIDSSIRNTIRVQDQINKPRGLDQRFSLHCGPFGSDAAYGSVPALTYVTAPSYHKTNRNRKRRMYSAATEGAYYTASVYDNRFVQHTLPQSPEQYAWITASVIAGVGNAPMGFAPPGVLSASVLNQLVTGSGFPYYGDGFRNNFARICGPAMRSPSVDIQSRTSQAHLGTYSGKFNQFILPSLPGIPLGTGLGCGPAADWNDILGRSGVGAQAFTWSTWVYQTAYNSADISILFTVGQPGAGLSGRYLAIRDTGQLEFTIYDDGPGYGQVQTANDVIKLNTWHHVAAVYTGGTAGNMGIYVDGRRISNFSVNIAVGAPVDLKETGKQYSMFIGSGYFSYVQWPLIGYMADAAIWGTASGAGGALSDAQVNRLYNGGSPPNIKKKLSTGLVAWYRFNPWLGDSVNLQDKGNWNNAASMVSPNGIVKNAVSGSGLGAGVDTQATAFNLELRRFSPLHVDQLNNYLNNQNGPYGWPTWKQIRTGETPVARALSKNNYIGQVVPPGPVPKLIRNFAGSMVRVGSVPALRPNTATLYYEPPINNKMGMVEFYLEDNTENSSPENNMVITMPYGNDLEYFNNDGLNNRLGLTINLNKPTAYKTVRDFLVAGSLSTVVRYSEKMYPAQDNIYRSRIRSRTSYNISGIWNSDRVLRSKYGGLTGSMGQVEGKKYTTMTGSNSSIWPLDGHSNYTTTSSVRPWDGAGELMNSYSRYSASYAPGGNLGSQSAAPTYAWRVPTGRSAASGYSLPVLAGDVKWTAGEEAGKDPYENYSTWGEQVRTVGKDQSLVPEFRISQHLRTYYDKHAGNFLTDNISGIYEISGASIPNSSENNFFKTYSNSDFMKYFRVIDDSLNDHRSGDLKIERDRIKLKASGLIKFLPYKGFYPAERTLQIAAMFSQSYGSTLLQGASIGKRTDTTALFDRNLNFRIAFEPLFSPGIIYNTIKSGIAVGHCVLVNTASVYFRQLPASSMSSSTGMSASTQYPEGALYFNKILNLGTGSNDSRGYHLAKVPFETIQDPSVFFNANNLAAIGNTRAVYGVGSHAVAGFRQIVNARIFDTAIYDGGAALPAADNTISGEGQQVPNINFSLGQGWLSNATAPSNASAGGRIGLPRFTLSDPEGGYRYAIDNFLCETTNFFMNGITSLRSNREDQFQTMKSGSIYKSVVKLYRSKRDATDSSRWDMYTRASAFGFPLGTNWAPPFAPPTQHEVGTFSHLLPPYYSGEATAELIYTASYDGKPTIDEIFGGLKIKYSRQETFQNYSASLAIPSPGINSIIPIDKTGGRLNDPRMQIDSSFNLKEKIQEVPQNTTSQINYWLIQSKFETPILNFANVTQSSPPGSTGLVTDQTSPANLITRGMWHQYGLPITSSTAGVFVEIADAGGEINSLADLVGFQKGITVRIGDIKKNAVLEEAIVAIPFIVKNHSRQFFEYTGTSTNTTNYANVESAMRKYVFPPKFDFVRLQEEAEEATAALEGLSSRRAPPPASRIKALRGALKKAEKAAASVQPILMYVFEFSVKISEQDIADMWQNLPPSIEEKIQEQEIEVEDRDLLRVMAENTQDIRWMVFKVKKRAKRDFDIYKRSLVTDDTSALAPKLRGPYSYNWPYDYFSLVELASIDATVQWASGDMQHEIEDDDMITLDGRSPLRGTDGAPPAPGRATPPLPGSNDGNPTTGRSAPTTDSGPNTERSPAPRRRRSREASTTRRTRTRSRRNRNGGGNNGGNY